MGEKQAAGAPLAGRSRENTRWVHAGRPPGGRRWRGALALGGVLVLGGAKPAAAAAFPIMQCGYTINKPGTYVLANDLSCPINGVVIEASNVHLVLNGHTITGPGKTAQVGADGIQVFGSLTNRLTGVSIDGGTVTGFAGDGINVFGASGLRISGVTASGNGNFGVIMVQACPGCRVVDSEASDNSSIGIAFISPLSSTP